MTDEELKPCPYCGEIDEIRVRENTTSPVMNRPPNVISCDITHWCKRDGLPRISTTVTGRDKYKAIKAWNTRALPQTPDQKEVLEACDRLHKQCYGNNFDARQARKDSETIRKFIEAQGGG